MTGIATQLTIGQVVERTGLSVHTLRLYEREGLLTGNVSRSANGRRQYSEWDVQWLTNCVKFRASGMPLATIRRFAELVREGSGNEEERLTLLRRHRVHILDRLRELTDCLELIDTKVESYEEHMSRGTAGSLWSGPTDGVRA
jgi:DNA-binding transcriptional MerR regulator